MSSLSSSPSRLRVDQTESTLPTQSTTTIDYSTTTTSASFDDALSEMMQNAEQLKRVADYYESQDSNICSNKEGI